MILMLMNPRKNRLFISFKFFLLLFFTKSFLMAQIESQDYKIIQSFNDVGMMGQYLEHQLQQEKTPLHDYLLQQ